MNQDGGGQSADSTPASARPVLLLPIAATLVVMDNLVQLTWHLDHTGWRIQAQTNASGAGLGTNWITLPTTDYTNQFTIPVNTANGSVFFRLISP